LKNVTELVYFFMKQREQYQEPGPMDKEGRPDAGQSEEKEGNSIHQPQLEPGLEPMDEEGRPARGHGKKEEGDYVRSRNRTIARKLCIILDINVLGDIFKTVLELVYFKEEAVRNQRAIPTTWQEQMAIEGRPFVPTNYTSIHILVSF
jgi:hypothetical protein